MSEAPPVRIILDAGIDKGLYNQLRSFMSHQRVSFSMNFERVATLEDFQCPTDVKISRKHQLIIVSGGKNKIFFFDLKTKQFKQAFSCIFVSGQSTERCAPEFLCVEENYDGLGNEALIFTTQIHNVRKFDLASLLNGSNKLIWESGERIVSYYGSQSTGDNFNNFYRPKGPVIIENFHYSSDEFTSDPHAHYLLVCDSKNKALKVLNPSNGQVLAIIYNEYLTCCAMNSKFQLILPSGLPDAQTSYCAMVIDRTNDRIIASEEFSHTVRVFTAEGELLKQFGGLGDTLSSPKGLALDEQSGELFVVDCNNHRVLVFK